MNVETQQPVALDMRERIILETIDRVAVVGPTSFNVKDVCEKLGISNSLINHHFGNRDSMLAEITERIYREYVTEIWAISDAAGPVGSDRLRAWMNASINWNEKYSGWALLLNYPLASIAITEAIDTNHRDSMRHWAEFNLSRLAILIRDIRTNTTTDFVWLPGEIPSAEILRDPLSTSIAGTVGWSTHGLAVWQSGRHLPSSDGIPELTAIEGQLKVQHIDRVIRLVTETP